MLYFGSANAQYDNAHYQMLGEGGDDYNFAQVDSTLVLTAPPGGAILRTLEFGANTDPSQAGGTIPIGIIDITDGTDGAPQIMSANLSLRSDDAGYVFSVLSGLSTALTAGRVYAINIGKPTVNVFVTSNDDPTIIWGEGWSPATSTLASTWMPDSEFIRNIPLRAGYDLASTAVIDSIDDPIRVGESFDFTSTDLGAITVITLSTSGNVTATTNAVNIDAPTGDGSAETTLWIEGQYMPIIGEVVAQFTDGEESASITTDLNVPTGYLSENFVNPITTDNTYITQVLLAAGHPVVEGEFIAWVDEDEVIVSPNGAVECDEPIVKIFTVQKLSGLIEKYSINISELSTTHTGFALPIFALPLIGS